MFVNFKPLCKKASSLSEVYLELDPDQHQSRNLDPIQLLEIKSSISVCIVLMALRMLGWEGSC